MRNLRKGDQLEDHGAAGKIIVKWVLKKVEWGAWIGPIWLKIGTGGGLLQMR